MSGWLGIVLILLSRLRTFVLRVHFSLSSRNSLVGLCRVLIGIRILEQTLLHLFILIFHLWYVSIDVAKKVAEDTTRIDSQEVEPLLQTEIAPRDKTKQSADILVKDLHKFRLLWEIASNW